MKASISYSDLHDASQEAHRVSKRFDDYADELQRKVLNKLGNYNGPWTSNMSNAYSLVSDKINELRTDCTRFEQYSTDLESLLDECKEVDEAVKSRVADLTADFKNANGIRNSAIENFLAYTFTSLGNSSALGRFLGNGRDARNMIADRLLQDIKVWFNFEGGKELIKAWVVDTLKIVGAIIAVAAAVVACVLSGGVAAAIFAAVALVSASVLLGMTIVDSCVDAFHEGMAYAANQNPGDAALAYRLRNINSYSDLFRNGFILDEHDQTNFNQNYAYRRGVAIAWDGLRITAKIANLVGSIGSAITGIASEGFKSLIDLNPGNILGFIGAGESFFTSLIEDGFQLSDLTNLDFTGTIGSGIDIGLDIADSIGKNFPDKPIDAKVIGKLASGLDVDLNIDKINIEIPKFILPTFELPLIQVPHIPVMSFGF